MKLLFLALVLISNGVRAADEFADVVFKSTQLSPHLYMLEGAGGNITASVGSDGTLLIDCDFAEVSEKLIAKLKELKGASPRMIVNTHFHYDHTGGNQAFGRTATIVAATGVRNRLMGEQILWKKAHPAFTAEALPIITFDTSLTLHLNGDEARVLHLPHGHTDGDSMVLFNGGNVASLGDLYFSGMYPIFHPEHDGSLLGYVDDLNQIIKLLPEGAQIVPGHGPLSGKTELVAYRDMIESSIKIVKSAMAAGFSLQKIQHIGLPKKWERFSHGYRTTDQWIESIYQALSQKQ